MNLYRTTLYKTIKLYYHDIILATYFKAWVGSRPAESQFAAKHI